MNYKDKILDICFKIYVNELTFGSGYRKIIAVIEKANAEEKSEKTNQDYIKLAKKFSIPAKPFSAKK